MWPFSLKCVECPKTYSVWKELKQHYEQEHMCPPDFKQNHTAYMTEIKKHASIFLQEQVRPSLKEAPFHCRFCQLTFKTRAEFHAHVDSTKATSK